MRIRTKQTALSAPAKAPRTGNQSGDERWIRFDRALSWQLDVALYLEETAGARFDRWLARLLRRRLEARLPRWVR